MNDSTSTTPTPSSPLDWFEDLGTEAGVTRWELTSELSDWQTHWVAVDERAAEPVVHILPIDAPRSELSIPELMTFIDELQRCLTAACFVAGTKAVAA